MRVRGTAIVGSSIPSILLSPATDMDFRADITLKNDDLPRAEAALRALRDPREAYVHAFLRAHARHEFDRAAREFEHRLDGVAAEVLAADVGVARAENEAAQFRFEDRPAAHRARFHRGVEREPRKLLR